MPVQFFIFTIALFRFIWGWFFDHNLLLGLHFLTRVSKFKQLTLQLEVRMAVLKSCCLFVFYSVEDRLLDLFGLLFRVVLNQHELIWTPVFKKNSRAFTCQMQVYTVKFVLIILSPHAPGTLHLFGDFVSLSLAISHKIIKQKSVFVFAFEFKFA